MGQPYICDKEEEVAAAAAAIPHTITSVNSGSKASRTGCYDDDDLPRTTTTAIQEAAASPKANKAKRRHMSQLFTKFLWHFRKPPGKWWWCTDMKYIIPFSFDCNRFVR